LPSGADAEPHPKARSLWVFEHGAKLWRSLAERATKNARVAPNQRRPPPAGKPSSDLAAEPGYGLPSRNSSVLVRLQHFQLCPTKSHRRAASYDHPGSHKVAPRRGVRACQV